jgi:hypothetical protein
MPFDTISPDIIVCGTGWRPSYHAFLDEELARELGLASPLPQKEGERTSATDQVEWLELEQVADAEICHDFPRLQKAPPRLSGPPTQSPFRLYKYMVPTHPDMSGIAFLGHIVVGNNFRAAECQAQWAVAYLDGQLSLPPKEEMEREVAMSIAWSRRRYLTKGALGHWLYFDLVPYTDALLEQLGLHSHRRKNKSKDFFSPCVAEDLKDLLSELREKQRSDLTEPDLISHKCRVNRFIQCSRIGLDWIHGRIQSRAGKVHWSSWSSETVQLLKTEN